MWRRRPGSPGGIVALAVLVVTCLVLFTIYVREDESGPLHTIQLGAAEVLRPVRGVASTIVRPLESAAGTVGNIVDENGEEEALRNEQRRNQELSARNETLESENERLRELVEGERSSYEYAPLARVIAPIGAQFTDRLIINVGSTDGVEPEQPVIAGNNTLVGRTTERVTANTAEVMLVTDRSFAAGVRIVPREDFDPSTGETTTPETPPEGTTTAPEATSLETTMSETTELETTAPETTTPSGESQDSQRSSAEGLFSSTSGEYLGVDLVGLDEQVAQGDFVVTSGRAGEFELLYPPGLLVGTVESVSSQDIEQYKKIVVEPSVQPEELEEVRVVTGW